VGEGPRIKSDNNEALWIEADGGLRVLAREGDRVASRSKSTFGPPPNARTFGSDNENLTPAVNDRGAVVFGALLRTGKTRLNSVWTNRSGRLLQIAAGALPISRLGAGDQAPGFPAGATFGTFQPAPFFSGSFFGTGVNASNDFALFRINPDLSTEIVLREGDTVEIADGAGATSLAGVQER
jgi:hypothetical protein